MSENKKKTDSAEAEGGIQAQVTRSVPDFECEVLKGEQVSPAGVDKMLGEGDKFTIDGPTAMSLASFGHVKIVGIK